MKIRIPYQEDFHKALFNAIGNNVVISYPDGKIENQFPIEKVFCNVKRKEKTTVLKTSIEDSEENKTILRTLKTAIYGKGNVNAKLDTFTVAITGMTF